MKKLVSICLLFLLFNFCVFAFNFTNASDYEYKNLNITADINLDGSMDVQEEFYTNFLVDKHGIIRTIPLNYSVGGKDFHIDISNIYVRSENFSVSKNKGVYEIKIGDADKTIIGEHVFPISYSVYGLIRNFSGMGYSELYWNLVGYDFDTNIDEVKAVIYLPKNYQGFKNEDFKITTNGITSSINDFEGKVDFSNNDRIIIIYDKKLLPSHGITLSVKFPNDYFIFDHDKQAALIGHTGGDVKSQIFETFDFYGRKLPVILSVLIIFASIFAGKKQKIKKSHLEKQLNDETPIVIRYEPPKGLNCAEAGMLYDCLLQPTDLTCLLYEWAIEGLISIKFNDGFGQGKSKGFIMTKLKTISDLRPQYEIDFFNSLFGGSINSQKLVSTADEFDVIDSLKELRNYGKSRGWIRIGGFDDIKKIVGFLIALLISVFLFSYGIHSVVSVIVPIFVFSIFFSDSANTPTQKRIYLTESGKKITSEILGYAKFIQACDENKLRLFLQQDPDFFDKTLPYAVAFGFESTFIRKITPILNELDIKPTWFDGDTRDSDLIAQIVRSAVWAQELREKQRRESERYSSYSSDSGFSSGSSFSSGGFSSGGGGGGGGSRSW